MKQHALISQPMLVGDDRPFVADLVTLEPDELERFADDQGIQGSPAELREHAVVRQEVQRAVDYANEAVSRAESIRKFAILDRQFSQDRNELTPTLKPRRRDIAEHFAAEIEQLSGDR